jgi:TetR/AcrR family transcriptional regulator, transcriptional repressor for nem operon
MSEIAVTPTKTPPATAQRILDVAERLVQQQGYNGFSYADIAGELGITKAALHYHFASKAELGQALIERYSARFMDALCTLDEAPLQPAGKLEAYAGLYAEVLREQRMCLCGMLAAEYQTLPPAMRAAVLRFLEDNTSWLAGVLADGRAQGTLFFEGAPVDGARTVLSVLQGAMLIARPYADLAQFQAVAAHTLAGLGRG